MQIHELNNFTGTLGSGAYLAIDDGTDTGKISSQGLLAATEARIDNIIAGPAPSAEEIVDARLGADGVTYPSLGDAIRDQFTDVKSALSEMGSELYIAKATPDTTVNNYRLKTNGNAASNSSYNIFKYYVSEGEKLFIKAQLGSQEDDRAFQFQDSATVKSSGNESHIVGTPVDTAFSGYVTVPSGANTLIISALKTDTTTGVYKIGVVSDAEQLAVEADNVNYVNGKIDFALNSERISPTSIADGWMLNSNGVSEENAGMRILKYSVSAGSKVILFARRYVNAVYQFQNSSTIPGREETPRYRVGYTILKATAEELTVPTGATYLMVNDVSNGDNGLYIVHENGGDDDDKSININNNLLVDNLIAHKGGSNGYDGSINRLKYSYEHGYKILEMDVQFTSDGIPVIHHNSSISSGGETIEIPDTTYATLITYDLGDGSHIMSLDEAVLFCKKRGLAIEIDLSNATMNSSRATAITDIVINRGMLGSTVFTGVPAKQAYITAITNKAILSVSSLYDEVTTETIDAVAEYLLIATAVICSINHTYVTEALVNYAHQKGLIVKTWTHTGASTVNADLAIGVDLAICDNVYPDTFVITD